MTLSNPDSNTINALREMMRQGLLSEDDLANLSVSSNAPEQGQSNNAPLGIFNAPNQLAPIIQGPQAGLNQWDKLQSGEGVIQSSNGDGSLNAPIRINKVPPPTWNPQAQGNAGIVQRPMGTEQTAAGAERDMSRPEVQLFGKAPGYYGKDGKIYHKDGTVTTILPEGSLANFHAQQKRQMDMQKFEADQANTQARTEQALETTRASKINNPDFMGQGGTGAAGATGDAALSGVPQPIADQVKALAEGRQAFPAGFALKSPYWQNMISLVTKYDPTFDAVNYQNRAATRKDFTSGKSADNITALNTAISHLGNLSDSYAKLNNSDFPLVNKIANYAGQQLGNQTIQKNLRTVDAESEAVAHELAKVFRSTGMSEKEIAAWKEKIQTSAAPAESKAVVDSAIELMNGRLEALGARYTQGMGTTKSGIELLTPQSKSTIERLAGGKVSQPTGGALEFATAADAARAGLKDGTKIKVGGVSGTWKN